MNCPDWEERIALHAQGDLSPQEAAPAQRHLGECEECREFRDGVRQSLSVLRGAHEEPLPQAHYAMVRARTLEQLTPIRRPRWRLAWIPALAAVGALVVFFLVRPQPIQPPRAAITPPPAPTMGAAPAAAPSGPPRRMVPARRRPGPPPSGAPLLVKLVTDDPDVVIYWIPN